MSNARNLKALMVTHSLKSREVADLIGVSLYTVKAWLINEGAGKFRRMKDRDLEYLRLKLSSLK